MKNQVALFKFENSNIRTVIDENNEPLFVGKDVCEVLGYSNPSKSMNDHCRGVTHRYPILDSLGRTQEVRVLKLSDVLRLCARCTLPAGIKFEALIFEEILPSIHKTGSYGVTPTLDLDNLASMQQLALSLVQKVQAQAVDVAAMRKLEVSKGSLTPRIAAPCVGMTQNRLIHWLLDHKWCYRGEPTDNGKPGVLRAYSTHVKRGLVEEKLVDAYQTRDGFDVVKPQLHITAAGMAKITKLTEGLEEPMIYVPAPSMAVLQKLACDVSKLRNIQAVYDVLAANGAKRMIDLDDDGRRAVEAMLNAKLQEGF